MMGDSNLKMMLLGNTGQFNDDPNKVDLENGQSNENTEGKCQFFGNHYCSQRFKNALSLVLGLTFLVGLFILIFLPHHPRWHPRSHPHSHMFDVSSGSHSWSESGSWNGEN